MANINLTSIAKTSTFEYTISSEAAASYRVPMRTDISRRELHKRLGRFNRSNGTNYQLPS